MKELRVNEVLKVSGGRSSQAKKASLVITDTVFIAPNSESVSWGAGNSPIKFRGPIVMY
ncbi:MULTISPECIES: hypothetical protein [unclassified Pseudoalteromonas]|uniref:hypothetical protein n=1 Tax=unclassified Pseudoalteromonas TaxID=194690 RepID=UPI000B16522C|nr:MULTISPECIES: hypothetical protein [unclassified Pseudoalteromonas]